MDACVRYRGIGEDQPMLNAIVENTFPHIFRIATQLMQMDVSADTGEIMRVVCRIFDELVGVRVMLCGSMCSV